MKDGQKQYVICIMDSRLRHSVREVFSILMLVVLPIIIGIIADSSAMQWAGFLFGIATLAGFVHNVTKKNTRYTIQEARQLLDEIEKAEQP